MAKNKEEQTTTTTGFQLPEVLSLALGAITKEYGKGSVVQANSNSFLEIERLSTGCLSLDDALGGGFPRGRIVEIYGPESSGKTTVALCTIAELHRNNPEALAAIIDAEHALDLQYAEKLGVDLQRLFISQPDSAEEALNITDALVRTGSFSIIVVDSVAALVPKKELEGEVGDAVMGLQARLMGQALRKVTGATNNTNTLLVFINQLRMKIGVMFGNPETTAGGNALKFYASIRVDIRRTGNDKVGDDVTASTTRVKIVKNKTAPPYKVAEFKIKYGQGIDVLDDLIEKAVAKGIVVKAGAWVKYKGENYSGQSGFEAFINTTEGALAKLKDEVLNAK